jgi:hypothetical protein
MNYELLIVQDTGNRDPHVACFQEVAEAMAGALHDMGHNTCIRYGDIVVSGQETIPIIFGAQHIPRLGIRLPPNAIIYNMEQAGSQWFTPDVCSLYKRYSEEGLLWDYSAANTANFARMADDITPRIVPFGWHKCLERIKRKPETECDIDVLHVGSMNDRRARVLDELSASGLNVVRLFGIYGAERDSYYARAKVVLNIHYYETAIFEAARCNYLSANGICVVSETSAQAEGSRTTTYCPYRDLTYLVSSYVTNAKHRNDMADYYQKVFRTQPMVANLGKVLGTSCYI